MTDLGPYKMRVELALGTFLRKSKYETVKDAQKAIVDFLMVYLSIGDGFEIPLPPCDVCFGGRKVNVERGSGDEVIACPLCRPRTLRDYSTSELMAEYMRRDGCG